MLSITVQKRIEPFKVLALVSEAFPSLDLDAIQFTDNDDGSTTISLNAKVGQAIVQHDFNPAEFIAIRKLL